MRGIAPVTAAHLPSGKGGRDGTVYGSSRTSTQSFYTHHLLQMGLAAKVYNAKAMKKEIGRRRAIGAPESPTNPGPACGAHRANTGATRANSTTNHP